MASILRPVSILLAVLLPVPLLFGDFTAYQIALFLIYGIAAQGIGFLWGKTGVLPLGQALFFGVAAYAAGSSLGISSGLVFQLGVLGVIMLVLALFAFGLGALIFKGRNESGPYFSLITLALVMIAEQIAGTATSVTGGFNGLSGFDSLFDLDPFGSFYYMVVFAACGVTLLLLWINRLPVNLLARAVSDNEPRLQLLGFATHKIKALAFAFSAAIAALAGWLYASHQGIVTPTSTGFALSAELVILAAVGGRFHVLGPLIGAVAVGWVASELRDTFPYWEILMAVAFILVVLKAPGGLAELCERAWRAIVPQKPPKIAAISAPPARKSQDVGQLKFEGARVRIGVVNILNGVTFKLPQTGIVSIIGPNGAGKTSTLNCITGNMPLTSGRITKGQTQINNRPPHKALTSGIGRKLQVPSVFFSMNVQENLAIASMANRANAKDLLRRSTLGWRPDVLAEVLDGSSTALAEGFLQPVGHLPQGHRQVLEFAMTIAAEPPIVLLDEPCAGLSSAETAAMTEMVRRFQALNGGLVVVIEHDMSIVEAISDRVLVLHFGQVLAFDSYASVRANPDVQAVYIGGTK